MESLAQFAVEQWLNLRRISRKYFNEEQRSLFYRVMHAAWMSLVITIPLQWKKFTSIFKRSRSE
jgi:hypothetical protein